MVNRDLGGQKGQKFFGAVQLMRSGSWAKKIGGVCLSLTRSEARGKKNRDTQRRAEGFGSSKKKFGSAQMNGRAEGLSKKLGGGKDGRTRQKLVEWIKRGSAPRVGQKKIVGS